MNGISDEILNCEVFSTRHSHLSAHTHTHTHRERHTHININKYNVDNFFFTESVGLVTVYYYFFGRKNPFVIPMPVVVDFLSEWYKLFRVVEAPSSTSYVSLIIYLGRILSQKDGVNHSRPSRPLPALRWGHLSISLYSKTRFIYMWCQPVWFSQPWIIWRWLKQNEREIK